MSESDVLVCCCSFNRFVVLASLIHVCVCVCFPEKSAGPAIPTDRPEAQLLRAVQASIRSSRNHHSASITVCAPTPAGKSLTSEEKCSLDYFLCKLSSCSLHRFARHLAVLSQVVAPPELFPMLNNIGKSLEFIYISVNGEYQ